MSRRRYMMPASGGGGFPVPTVWWDGHDEPEGTGYFWCWAQRIGIAPSDEYKIIGLKMPGDLLHVVNHYHLHSNAMYVASIYDNPKIIFGGAGSLELIVSIHDLQYNNQYLLASNSYYSVTLNTQNGVIRFFDGDGNEVWNSLTDSGKSWGADEPVVLHITKNAGNMIRIYADGTLMYSGVHNRRLCYTQQKVGGPGTDLYSFRVWDGKVLTQEQIKTAVTEMKTYYNLD